MTERHGPEHSLANAAAQAVCPLAAANAHTTAGQAYATAGQAPAAVEPIAATNALAETDLLTLPMRKRMVAQYITDAGGAKALHLFYDDKEISFDEAELFAIGECLTKQTSFTAGSAVGWGEGYTWPTIRVLLQQL